MNDTTTRRTDNVRVKLAPDMMERLERMAGNYGMPTATLCAFAIAEWVTGKENNLAMSRMAVMDMGRKMGGQIGDMISQMADSGIRSDHRSSVCCALSDQSSSRW